MIGYIFIKQDFCLDCKYNFPVYFGMLVWTCKSIQMAEEGEKMSF